MPRRWKRRMHDGAAAVIVLSAGIMIGAWGRSHRADPAPPAPTPDAPLAPADTAPSARPPGGAAVLEAPLIPAAPSFAGSYSVLPGARTAGSPEPPPFPGAPDMPVETPTLAQQADTAAPSSAEPRVKEPPRPRPAQAIPRGIALQSPLLALARPGGRVVLHGLSAAGGPIPAAIEGDWGVIGRCTDRVRIDFAVPAASAGAMRGIGRAQREPEWRVEPLVPTHVCAAASRNYQRPRTPDETRRVTFGMAGAAEGFRAQDLRELVELRGGALLLFQTEGRALLISAARGPTGPSVLWSHAGSDGAPWLLGVYRSGTAMQAWVLFGDRACPRAVLVVSSMDGRHWTTTGPIPLRDE
jgi:hypothetical protein